MKKAGGVTVMATKYVPEWLHAALVENEAEEAILRQGASQEALDENLARFCAIQAELGCPQD